MMSEFYAWASINTDTYEEDFDELDKATEKIKVEAKRLELDIEYQNWTVIMWHYDIRSEHILDYIEFFHFIAKNAPGSYGLFYLRDYEEMIHKDQNQFLVFRMVRGEVQRMQDTYLSPCVPVIEDPEPGQTY